MHGESRIADSTFTFRLDEDLKAAFAAASDAEERTAAQQLRVLMRQHVARQQADEAHDAWFRQHIELAISEFDDGTVELVPHDEVATDWQRTRARLERRGAGRSA